MRRSGLIYFIEAEIANLVKIGYTRNIQSRVGGLATFSPVRLRLIGLIYGSTADEEALHRQLAAHRSHGEWFRRSPEMDAAMLADGPRLLLESMSTWDGFAGIRGAELTGRAGRPVGSKDSYKRTRKAVTREDRYRALMDSLQEEFPLRFIRPA